MFKAAVELVLSADSQVVDTLRLSLMVSLGATLLAALAAVPAGALVALTSFRGRSLVIVILNSLMGLPPVLVGLTVYLLLSRSGPLGSSAFCSRRRPCFSRKRCSSLQSLPRCPGRRSPDLWEEYRDEFAAMDVRPMSRTAGAHLGCAVQSDDSNPGRLSAARQPRSAPSSLWAGTSKDLRGR
jgi:tungstate transport system permease protein